MTEKPTHAHTTMINSCSSWFILTTFIIASVVASDYSLSGDFCSKHDNCYSKPVRTCSCDENCHVYGICCSDVGQNRDIGQNSLELPFRCYNKRTATPVFVKRSCPEDFRGHVGTIDACLDEDEDEMDVKNNLLVTSHKTKITYWNSHCAACNHEASDDLELWNIEVHCPPHKDVTRNLIRRNLTFDQDKSQWGLRIDDEFLQCVVKYAPPPYIDEVRYCTPNLISSCPEEYSGREIIKKCSQYYAERKLKHSEIYYKNIHCAICNSANIRQLECPGMSSTEDDPEDNDFGEMVEEVFLKGDWLRKTPGRMFECSPGYSYDAFQVRCRRDKTLDAADVVEDGSSHAFKKSPSAVLLTFFVLSVIL